MSRVNPTLECPNIFESVFTDIPDSKARVANVWRSPCTLMTRIPFFTNIFLKSRCRQRGSTGVPTVEVNTNPLSGNPFSARIIACSSLYSARCFAMSGSRRMVRIECFVLGSLMTSSVLVGDDLSLF